MFPSVIFNSQIVKNFVHHKDYPDSMSIGQRIYGARLAKGYKVQAEFARACGLDRQYVNNLEGDKVVKADPHNLAKIARLLGIDLHWLVTGEGPPNRITLDADEQDLISAYRKLSHEKQVSFLTFLNSML